MQSDLAHRSCSMDVLLVRTVEKVVDAVQGKFRKTEWNAPLAKAAGLAVLQVSTHLLLCMPCLWFSRRFPCMPPFPQASLQTSTLETAGLLTCPV